MNDTALSTNGETYFFRDRGQFDLLRRRLLPELIERCRSAKTLRLWSAGCSSGEEAYSLAMLLDMLLPEHNRWDISIHGSDINQSALDKAERGHYGQWSFRMAPRELQQHYFRRKGDGWVLDERIRRMVTFRAIDLATESFPARGLQGMDLILCRNVFIYFDAATVATVADKLATALSEDGYLVTAHTELIGHRVQNLQSRLFAESVVYQRASPKPAAVIPQPSRITPPPAVVKRVPGVPPVPLLTVPCAEDLLAAAHEFANRGEYGQAAQTCRQALTIAPLAPEPHFLLAQLAQIKGDFEQARELLDKTLYLNPRNVAATLELAALCERAENLPRAQTLRRAALDIVHTLPANTAIEPYEATAAEMARWLAQRMVMA